jgi:TadE-like protein
MRNVVAASRIRGRRRSIGQALTEFALVAPIFFLLLFSIIEGGRFIFFYQALNNATREGARYAIVHGANSSCPSGPMPPGDPAPLGCYDPPGANVVQRVKDAAFGALGPSILVTPSWGALGNGREADVTVIAAYTYQTLVPIPFPQITITAESKLVINN